MNHPSKTQSLTRLLRRARPTLLPVLVLVGGGLAYVGLSSLQPARPPATVQERTAPLVRVVPLESRTVTLDVVGHGTARARDLVQVGSEVGGQVAFVSSALQVGSFVAEGEVLIRLEPRAYAIAKRAAKADVDRAHAELERLQALAPHLARDVELGRERVRLAKGELQRQQDLEESGIAAASRLDQARTAWATERGGLQAAEQAADLLPHQTTQARAALDRSEAMLQRADFDLERLVLRAPIAGQVRARQVDVGQIVAPGTALVGVANYDVYEVAVQLSHEDLVKLALIPRPAVPRSLPVPGSLMGTSAATVTWVAHPETKRPAVLTRIESVDSDTRTVPVVVEVTQPWAPLLMGGTPLLPGAYCRVRLLGKTRANAWVIPEHALREGDRLYVLREGKLAILSVTVDHLLPGEAVITPAAAFLPTDRLIVSPITYPVVGMKLRVEGGA